MDNEYLLTIFETLEEIKETIERLRTEPLTVTPEEIDALDYNLGVVRDFANQLKRRE